MSEGSFEGVNPSDCPFLLAVKRGENEMATLWWKLKPVTMAKLIQFQYSKYGTKLDLMTTIPPGETADISPDTQQQMTDETNREMESNTDVKARVK